jgi:hypothetical protein
MYNTNYECRYHKDSVFTDSDVVTEAEKEFIRDVLYREDLLHIFCIDNNDDSDIFDSVILELYQNLNACQELKDCMRLAAARLVSENEHLGLCILYSYDFMHLTHKCVSSYLESGEIYSKDLIELKNKL